MKMEKKVFKTSYENGTQIIVNYNRKGKTVDGQWIEGLGYAVVEGERK